MTGRVAGGESAYNEESADPVYPPVPVEVQGIIYIYNPPKVQNAGETAGDNGGQAAPAHRRPSAARDQPAAQHHRPAPPARAEPRQIHPTKHARHWRSSMKSKTKFDPKVIQQFFIDHTEKFVMGLVAALFLFFAYQSFVTVRGYEKKPEELKTATGSRQGQDRQWSSARESREGDVRSALRGDHRQRKKTIDPGRYPMPPGLYWKPFAPLPSPRIAGSLRGRTVAGHSRAWRRSRCRSRRRQCRHRGNAGSSSRDSFPTKSNWPSIAPSSTAPPGTIPARTCRVPRLFVQRAEVVPGRQNPSGRSS